MSGDEWIAIDWGTSNLRGWSMRGREAVAQAGSDRGMGKLAPADFEAALVDLIGDWPGRDEIVACGMVGARQGWIEAPYAMTPCPALPAGGITAPVVSAGLSVRIIPGVAQDRPADVMRGEETQIAGFLALNPGWDGTLCLPGTHTKWVQVSAGEIISFRTVMTGELFSVIGGQTVLRHSLGAPGWDAGAFATAVDEAMSHPERVTGLMFSLRAESLLHGMVPAEARARLSGLLIGLELAGTRAYWLGAELAVIGAGAVADSYVAALAAQGARVLRADNDNVTLAGLIAARERWRTA